MKVSGIFLYHVLIPIQLGYYEKTKRGVSSLMSNHNPIAQIQKLGIPVDSYIVAAQAAGEFRRTCDATKYNELITQITGHAATFELAMAQSVFGYLVQEHVRFHINPASISNDEIEQLAVRRAAKLVKDQPWIWAAETNESETARITNREEALRIMRSLPDGTPRAALIQMIVDKLDVTPATAQTYLRDAVKKEEVKVAEAPKKPKINKRVAAIAFVKEHPGKTKAELLPLLAKHLDTTDAGAQTYYYAAIKELNITPTASSKKANTKAQVATLFDQFPDITRIQFIEQAEIQFDVAASTAQTYYYAILKERQKAST